MITELQLERRYCAKCSGVFRCLETSKQEICSRVCSQSDLNWSTIGNSLRTKNEKKTYGNIEAIRQAEVREAIKLPKGKKNVTA